MKFSLLILSAPYSSQAAGTALRFAETLLANGHSIYRVFFYQDGTHCGNALNTPPQDQFDITERWSALAKEHDLDLVLCISSALKRGILDEREANRYEKPAHNMADGFVLSGLGQWVDATIESDRCVSFGA